MNALRVVSHQARAAAITLAALSILLSMLVASLWLASFFLYAGLRVNPFHGGLWGWFDAVLAWRDGLMPNYGRRLAGAAFLGVVMAFGGPAFGVHAFWERSSRRRLYGSARFASDAEIRKAGLL
jgi:type IV secretory pathway TraG/TraD family ATPase VirD4